MNERAKASRPLMPEYGLLAADQGSGLIPWSRVSEQMAAARNYWVATTRPDGHPHVMPVWGVWLDEAFYFASGRQSRKARNLAENPSIVVHLESGDDVVILEGVVEVITDPDLLARIVKVYAAKYNMGEGEIGGSPVFTVRPQRAFAWLERDFPGSATRWQFDIGSTP